MPGELTKSQHTALRRWRVAKSDLEATPRHNGTRTDVAARLVELGYLSLRFSDDKFRGGYAELRLTAKGREHLDWHP
jgi:hypothetical protein